MNPFDWIAPYYDRLFNFSDVEPMLALLQLGPGQSLLDVGGGTGRVTSALVAHVGRACVVDPAAGMLVQARAKGLCIYQSVAEHLPFPAGAFDRILVVDAFHHFQDQSQAARELLRVLRPGGRLLIKEPDNHHGVVKLVNLAERLLFMHAHVLAPADLARQFQSAGGQVMLYEGYGAFYCALVQRRPDNHL